jgi:hypothetical protein
MLLRIIETTYLSNLLNTDQLLARVQYLNELVYPAISQKAKRKQAQDTVSFINLTFKKNGSLLKKKG